MACVIVPMVEAVITTAITKVVERKEKKAAEMRKTAEASATVDDRGSIVAEEKEAEKELLSSKLKRLNGLLWGGSALLVFEHIWHGEFQAFFPFFTAAESAESLAEMFHEMATVGVGMAAFITIAWAVVNGVVSRVSKKTENKDQTVTVKVKA